MDRQQSHSLLEIAGFPFYLTRNTTFLPKEMEKKYINLYKYFAYQINFDEPKQKPLNQRDLRERKRWPPNMAMQDGKDVGGVVETK
jgi:hypothetical protein